MVNAVRLRYFIAAAEAGGFRRAAEVLDCQQSTVSRSVRRMEDELGVSLFERGPNGIRLTDAGNRFLAQALPAFEQLQAASRMAAAAGRGEIGIVRIGTLAPLVGGFLRQLIQQYAAHNQGIVIDVLYGDRRYLLAGIRARKLDIAFISGAKPAGDYEMAGLWCERIYVAMPRHHRLADRQYIDWPDLKGERFIVSRLPPGPQVHDHIVRRIADGVDSVLVEYRDAAPRDLVHLVGVGQGITLVSEAWEGSGFPNVVVRPLCDAADVVPFTAVWSAQNDNPALRRFVSVAHVLAGKVRHGNSDWVPAAVGLNPVDGGTSVDGQRPDPSP